ncbi:MAG: BON domain-containing protein [Nitrospiraceae bacterium]
MARWSCPMLLVIVALLAGCEFMMPNPYTTPVSVAMTATEVAVDERTLDEMGDDLKVKTAILRALAGEGREMFMAVSVDVYQGDVLMTGAVKTSEDDRKAEALVKKVEGVSRVYNELHITEDFGMRDSMRDTGIELKVKFAVMSGAGFRYPNYRWRATHGTVYLFGIAQTEEEYDSVYDKVRGINEVERLITHIRIKPAVPTPDESKDTSQPASSAASPSKPVPATQRSETARPAPGPGNPR